MRAEPPRGQGPGPATQISLETLVVARELHGGDFTFSPLAELARVAHGDAEALDELHFFLCNYLPGIPPEAIAAYAAAPADDGGAAPTLLHVDVPLARPDLPRRGNRRLLPPLSIPCVVVPADPTRGPEERGDRWVIVLPLRHVLHVPAGADLEATLRAEIQRLVSAEERSPQDYLELLPAAETTLQRLALTIEIPERMPPPDAAPDGPAFKPVPPGSYPSAVIVLLTDGQATTGVDPIEAAKMAADRGVRIFTVGIGTKEGEILRTEGWSMRVRLDEESLKSISFLTRGEYFYAGTATDLKKVYASLNTRFSLEKRQTEITALFAAAAALFAVLAAGLSVLWFNRIL